MEQSLFFYFMQVGALLIVIRMILAWGVGLISSFLTKFEKDVSKR